MIKGRNSYYTHLTDFELSSFHELSRCSTDKEDPSTEVGVVLLDKIDDWFGRFETMETMDQLFVCVIWG